MTKSEIKVGDRVHTYHRLRGDYAVTIVRETNTLWISEDGSKWNKKTHRLVGASVWDSQHIQPMTPDLEEQVRVSQRRRAIKNTWSRIHDLPTPFHIEPERLAEILAELQEPTA